MFWGGLIGFVLGANFGFVVAGLMHTAKADDEQQRGLR